MAEPYEQRPGATKQSSRTKGMSFWDRAKYAMSGEATKDKIDAATAPPPPKPKPAPAPKKDAAQSTRDNFWNN